MKKLFKKGFTLVELLVVIAIIAILGTVSVVGYIGFTEDAKVSNDFTELTEYKTVAEAKLFDGSEVVEYSAAVKYESKDFVSLVDGETTKTYLLTDCEVITNVTGKTDGKDYKVIDSKNYAPKLLASVTTKKVGDVKTPAVYKEFVYTVSGSSKAISLYDGVYGTDGNWDRSDDPIYASTSSNLGIIKDCLVKLLSKSTGETVNENYFEIKGNLEEVGYKHSASLPDSTASFSTDNCKVVWTIATSTVAKA